MGFNGDIFVQKVLSIFCMEGKIDFLKEMRVKY